MKNNKSKSNIIVFNKYKNIDNNINNTEAPNIPDDLFPDIFGLRPKGISYGMKEWRETSIEIVEELNDFVDKLDDFVCEIDIKDKDFDKISDLIEDIKGTIFCLEEGFEIGYDDYRYDYEDE